MNKLYFKAGLFSIYLLVFLIVIQAPAIYYPDSQGYLNMDIIRSPGYPMFLMFLKYCFGIYFKTGLVIIQYAIGVLAIHFLIK